MRMLHDIEVPQVIADCVTINAQDINSEFVRLPGDVAYLAELFAESNRAHLQAKASFELVEARQSLYYRETSAARGGKTTEGSIKELVVIDPLYQAARMALVEAESERQVCRGRLDAAMVKKDALISLGASLRAERDSTEPKIKNTREDF